jgi:hypothetical protein
VEIPSDLLRVLGHGICCLPCGQREKERKKERILERERERERENSIDQSVFLKGNRVASAFRLWLQFLSQESALLALR